MICVDAGKFMPIKFEDLIDPNTGKTAIRYVDTSTDSYKIAREYMIRLEERDLHDDEFLKKMADYAKMTPEEFKTKFSYIAGKID